MRNARGFVLITALWALIVLLGLGSLMMVSGISQGRLGTLMYDRTNALPLAEAAPNQAARNLRTAGAGDDVLAATTSTGSFTIDSTQDLGGNLFRVTATGISQSQRRRAEAVFRLTPASVFQYALFGAQNVTVSGSAITDSYDSSEGPYDEDDAGHHGDVGTNASAPGSVDVSGSIFIDGQVAVGYQAGDPYAVVEGYDPLFITGGTSPPSDTQDVVAQEADFSLPQVTVPPGVPCTDLTVSGGTTQTLSPTGGVNGDGVYCYRNVTLQGGGTLTASGDVKVYVTGALSAKGNSTMGVPDSPEQLLVFMTSSSSGTLENGTFTGSTKFYGALYAPSSAITITGNAEVFGSMIADAIFISGSASVHYDEATHDLTQVSNTFTTQRISWREL